MSLTFPFPLCLLRYLGLRDLSLGHSLATIVLTETENNFGFTLKKTSSKEESSIESSNIGTLSILNYSNNLLILIMSILIDINNMC